MEEPEVDFTVAFKADSKPAKAVKPGEEALHFPAMTGDLPMDARAIVAFATRHANLGNAMADAASMQVFPEAATVVTTIRRQCGRTATCAPLPTRHLDGFQCGHRSFQIVDFSSRQMQPQRESMAVDDHVALAGQAGAGAPDLVALFLPSHRNHRSRNAPNQFLPIRPDRGVNDAKSAATCHHEPSVPAAARRSNNVHTPGADRSNDTR